MNLAAFAVDRRPRARDRLTATTSAPCEGLGAERPLLAWPLTISMLGLAGLPATVGFIGKLYLIEALVEGDYTWLAVFIAVGTMISLAYYLRVVAAMWMRPGGEAAAAPAIAGASPEADPIDPDAGRRAYLVAPALLAAAATSSSASSLSRWSSSPNTPAPLCSRRPERPSRGWRCRGDHPRGSFSYRRGWWVPCDDRTRRAGTNPAIRSRHGRPTASTFGGNDV